MLLILKFVKNVKVNMVMWQHNIWCVFVKFCVKMCMAHLFTQLWTGCPRNFGLLTTKAKDFFP